jgi:DNA repair photolyase
MWKPNEPKIADIKTIDSIVRKVRRGTILRLGGMTDCFQPCELEYGATFDAINILNNYGIGYLIVTKSHIVADDEYMSIYDKRLAHIQVTVTTLDDALSLTYEKASVPSKRIAAIKKLQEEGFDVAVRLSPLLEEYMDFDKLNGLGINKAVVEFLRVNTWIEKWFDIDYSKYTLKQSGYKHMPLEEKLRIISRIEIPTITVCEDVTEHYEYWRDHFNPNPRDCCNLAACS